MLQQCFSTSLQAGRRQGSQTCKEQWAGQRGRLQLSGPLGGSVPVHARPGAPALSEAFSITNHWMQVELHLQRALPQRLSEDRCWLSGARVARSSE